MASKSIRFFFPLFFVGLGLILATMPACHRKETAAQDQDDWRTSIVEQDGDFLITREAPPDIRTRPVKKSLSKAERQDDFLKLWKAADQRFCFFQVKNIDWAGVKETYQGKLDALEAKALDNEKTTQEFYVLLEELVDELRDFHSYIYNWESARRPPDASPDVLVGRVEGQAVVLRVGQEPEAEPQGLVPGSVIVAVDGKTVAERLAEIQKTQIPSLREAALLDDAYRELLYGAARTKVCLAFIPPGGDEPCEAELTRGEWSPMISFPPTFPVVEGKWTMTGKHPSGYGYIRITSFKGREALAEEFLEALKTLEDTPGLIIDIRDNPGGLGTSQAKIIGPFLTAKMPSHISFSKSGPEHEALIKRTFHLEPSPDRHYAKPVALLINSRTGSASDLFALRLISTARPVTVGQTTRGNLSGSEVYALLSCGMAVRISTAYVADLNGQAIDGRGSTPDIPLEPTIADLVQGRDAVLEAAIRKLEER